MAKCIFDSETNRGKRYNDPLGAVNGEYEVDIDPPAAGEFRSNPTRYVWSGRFEEYPEWDKEQFSLMVVKQDKAIRRKYADMLLAITAPYDREERETWKTQEEEARLWLADNESPCTMIRALAAARGITVELLAAKIIANADKFRAASGQILGMQQAELDILYPGLREEV